MINFKSQSKSLVVVSSLLLMAGLAACSKDNNASRPVSRSKMQAMCDGRYAFDVNAVNANRIAKMGADNSLTIVTSKIDAGADAKAKPAELVLSEKSAADFSGSADEVKIENKDCAGLKATYKGPGVTTGEISQLAAIEITGTISSISTNSITISGENSSVTVEKVMPSRKGDVAAYQLAMKDDASGINTLNITIEMNGQKITLKQQATKIKQKAEELEPITITAKKIEVDGDAEAEANFDIIEGKIQALEHEDQMRLEAEGSAAGAN